jgi:hypothetical protein
LSNQQNNKEELAKRALSFTTGSIADTPTTSYHTTIPSKHIIQAGMVKTTTIANGTKTTNTRLQTNREILDGIERLLQFSGAL